MSNRRREGFTGLGRRRKALPPKSIEVQDDSGQEEKIFLTVALRGELPSGFRRWGIAPGRLEMCAVDRRSAAFSMI